MTPSNITLTAAEVARVRLLVFQVQHRDLRGNNKGYNQLRQVQVLLQRAERRAAANRLLQDPQVIKDIFNNNNNENL